MPKHLCAQACVCVCACVRWNTQTEACLSRWQAWHEGVCAQCVCCRVWGEVEGSLRARHSSISSNPPQSCKVLVLPSTDEDIRAQRGLATP